MTVEVKVPVLAESVAEATLLRWRKKAGDAIRRGDILIDIETDKVTLEITAPEDGVLAEIVKPDGADVESDEVIAKIEVGGQGKGQGRDQSKDRGKAAAKPGKKAKAAAGVAKPAVAAPLPAAGATAEPAPVTAAPAAEKLSPAVRKLLQEHNLNAADIHHSGDRITKHDILAHLDPAAVPAPAPAAAPPPAVADDRLEQRVPMTRLRRRIAERLLSAQREHAILTTFNEVNMQPVMELRRKYKEDFEEDYGVKLGFMSFFTRASVEALKQFPLVNAAIDGDDIVYHGYFDIGIAVSSPRGLVVPVIVNADSLSFAEIEATVRDFGARAQDNKLSLEELRGGTFTITNGGVFGSMLSTPILNPPQSAILGMHKIQQRPVAEDGAVVIRPMMYLALSYDHRIIDGREAVSFLVMIKELLEDPGRLLLQV